MVLPTPPPGTGARCQLASAAHTMRPNPNPTKTRTLTRIMGCFGVRFWRAIAGPVTCAAVRCGPNPAPEPPLRAARASECRWRALVAGCASARAQQQRPQQQQQQQQQPYISHARARPLGESQAATRHWRPHAGQFPTVHSVLRRSCAGALLRSLSLQLAV
eukprot:scaffold1280_cov379-Prasinococcus_capsulatus_cf.AAC.21